MLCSLSIRLWNWYGHRDVRCFSSVREWKEKRNSQIKIKSKEKEREKKKEIHRLKLNASLIRKSYTTSFLGLFSLTGGERG